jgi:septal ring factor EnvC (AmiA/AmiB activator)
VAVLAVALSSAGLLTGGHAWAQSAERLKDIENAIAVEQDRVKNLSMQADEIAAEITRLQEELVKAAKEVQDREDDLAKQERMLATLEASESEKQRQLMARRGEIGVLLAALQRLSLQPREALLLGSKTPMDTVVTAQLLRFTMPPIEARARQLGAELAEITRLRNEAQARRLEIATATASLVSARESVKKLVELKAGLQQTTEAERQAATERVQALASQAKDLRELLAALPPPSEPPALSPDEAMAPAATLRLERPTNLKPFPGRRAGLTPPVRGELVLSYNDTAPDGSLSQGIVLETAPEAQVVAPHDGQVVFRGPFRGYGEILIIEHRGGYHTLLAGLGRTDAVVGQWLLTGEPVGNMESPRVGKPRLYIELRRGGRPINPWPWFEARISKVE